MAGEAKLEQYFKEECERQGIFIRKVSTPGNTGFPDRLIAYKGAVFFIELKNPNGRGSLSKKQVKTINTMMEHGLIVHVVSTKQEVHDVIGEITNR